MLVVGVETTGKEGSLALLRTAGESEEVLEVAPLDAGAYSAQLIPTLAAMLERHGCSREDISAIAAATGPGSFTGLRVGLAAVKGLGEVLQVPMAGVSLLEAIASQEAVPAGEVAVLADAGRGEVYCGFYTKDESGVRLRAEKMLRLQEVTSPADGVLVTPDALLAEALRARSLDVFEVERPRADLVARLGWKKIQHGQTITAVELEANYIRRSDAELYARP